MTYDYDRLYGETPDALGAPTRALVDFFERYDRPRARVLDLGCGQGRDAVFIARHGHEVLAVDLSANGIRDLDAAARTHGLPIATRVVDITRFTPPGAFDVILLDRTLHMLPRSSRLTTLARLLDHVAPDGWLLIADEPSNMPDYRDLLAPARWQTEQPEPGLLFARRA